MMLTSAGQRGDAARCRKLGVSAYLIKPIRQSELLEAVLAALEGKRTGEEQPTLITRHWLREERQRLRILVAEDNVVNQEFILRLLEKRGHIVKVTRDGREALAALEKDPYDLMVMDVRMPEMDGLEATALIRERERGSGRRLPIIAMTAHAMKGDRERCLAAGMDAYISKPVNIQELFLAIQSLTPDLGAAAEIAPNTRSAPERLDFQVLLDRVEGDAELLAEMATLFSLDCPKRLEAIREAIRSHDARTLEIAAHALKGSLSNFTSAGAFETAHRLEIMGRDGNIESAGKALEILEAEIARLDRELAALRKGTLKASS
jgi:CheY-like chemotaxis protein